MKFSRAFLRMQFYLIILCGTLRAQTGKVNSLPANFDKYVENILQQFKVPGMSIAVVKDGKQILAKGYGIRKKTQPDKVDDHTLFIIASNTKAFTATALAILVEEGKLNWTDKVVDIIPWFKMSDVYATSKLTIRELLVHHSGLPAQAGDLLMFPPSDFSRRDIVDRLQYIPLEYDFRTTYAYDNILYLVAGEVVHEVSGLTWEDFITQRIFPKVGMTTSFARFTDFQKNKNIAWSHVREADTVRVIERFMTQNAGNQANPAGGILSNATDMAKWMLTQLDSGRTTTGAQLLKPAATADLWKGIRPMPITRVPDEIKPMQQDFWIYGSGFRNMNYKEHKLVYHGGALKGQVSQVVMIPELNFGITVLTNQQASGAYWSVIYTLIDHFTGKKPFDWAGGYKKILDSSLVKSARDFAKIDLKKDANAKPPLSLTAFAGTYNDPFAGDFIITGDDQQLVLRFSNSYHFVADLEYLRYNTFLAKFRNPDFNGDSFLTFNINPDGSISQMTLKPVHPNSSLDFDQLLLKRIDRKIKDTAALAKAIQTELNHFPGVHFGFAFKNLSTGETYFVNGTDSFHSASTMKTPVMIETYKQAEAKKFSLSDSVIIRNSFLSIVDKSTYSLDSLEDSETELYRIVGKKTTIADLIYRMITKSSNLATNLMIDIVGAENVTATVRSFGANKMMVRRGVEDKKAVQEGLNNTTTPNDLMLVFEQLALSKIVSEASCDSMISILMHQYFRDKIPGKLPPGVKTATKSGSFAGTCHDSGIVFLPDGRKYVLVLLSTGNPNHESASNLLSNISKIFYDYIR